MTATAHLSQPVNFGGVIVSLGQAIAAMRAEGHDEKLIDRWAQGAYRSAQIGR